MLSGEIQPKDFQEAIEFFSSFERLWFPGAEVSTRSECLDEQLMLVRLLRQGSNQIIFVGIRRARHHGTTTFGAIYCSCFLSPLDGGWRSGCERAYTQMDLLTGRLAPASGICNRAGILYSPLSKGL